MKKIKGFFNRNSATMLMFVCTFIVALAEKATTMCYLNWHYEPTMPACLREEE